MKLFRETGNIEAFEYTLPEMELKEGADIPTPTGKNKVERVEKIELELVPETVTYLLTHGGGQTLGRIRQLILHLFNNQYYTDLDLFSLMRNADDEHVELVVNIIESCSLKYGDSCFKMIDDFAPKMIDVFGYADDEDTA